MTKTAYTTEGRKNASELGNAVLKSMDRRRWVPFDELVEEHQHLVTAKQAETLFYRYIDKSGDPSNSTRKERVARGKKQGVMLALISLKFRGVVEAKGRGKTRCYRLSRS